MIKETAKPIIQFKEFNFQYRSLGSPTLKNINLSIFEGEKILIAGPSGSGKSTLGHCLNGLIPFSYSGEITGDLTINDIEPICQPCNSSKNNNIEKIINE